MKFVRRPNGTYRLIRMPLEETLEPIAPGSTVVEFDETTNQALVDSLDGRTGHRWDAHTISGGQILRSGTPIAIGVDATETADRKALFGGAAQAIADIDSYLTAADTGTAAQQLARDHAALKRLAQIQRVIIRRLLQITKDN